MSERDFLNNGFYRVNEITVEGYEDGEPIEPRTYWGVENILCPENECYECRNKDVAEDLCIQLNMLTCDLALNKTLPESVMLTEEVCLCKELALRINEKHEKLTELQHAMEHELVCELRYKEKCNHIKLHPGIVKDELELFKNPTEKQIDAYCEETFQREFKFYKIAKTNVSFINKQIDLLNDYISLEKYIIRKELKE